MRRALHAITLMLSVLTASAVASSDRGIPARLNQPISAERLDQRLFDEAVVIYSNAVRRQHGRAALQGDPRLSRAASDHARNMAKLRTHSHELPVRGQANLKQRMHRQSLAYRLAAENIAMDKVYRLVGRPIAVPSQGCSLVYGDTHQAVPIHTYASLAAQVVARWMASPKHRESLLSARFARIGAGVGIDPRGTRCGDLYLVQTFAD